MALSVKDMRAGDYPDAFKFAEVGDGVSGEIVAVREMDRQDLNGNPQHTYVLQLRAGDGTEWTVWAPEGKGVIRAVKAAAVEAGADSIEEGGKLAVKFTGLGTASKPGYSPPKLFSATYSSPKASFSLDDI